MSFRKRIEFGEFLEAKGSDGAEFIREPFELADLWLTPLQLMEKYPEYGQHCPFPLLGWELGDAVDEFVAMWGEGSQKIEPWPDLSVWPNDEHKETTQ